jgi:hypothetical protein
MPNSALHRQKWFGKRVTGVGHDGYENNIITIIGLDNQCIVQILAQDDQHILQILAPLSYPKMVLFHLTVEVFGAVPRGYNFRQSCSIK